MLGQVKNESRLQKVVPVTITVLILGCSAVGAYVGLRIGGAVGAAVGALVGAFVGSLAGLLASGLLKTFRVKLHKDGWVEVQYETRFA